MWLGNDAGPLFQPKADGFIPGVLVEHENPL